MSPGEGAALEGLLSQQDPRLSIEVATAEGGSLDVIAAHSAEVHAIDIADERLVACPANATLCVGDSTLFLPELLSRFAASERDAHESLRRGPSLVHERAPAAKPGEVTARIPLDAEHLVSHQLRRELDAIRSSWSWRVTRPLRAIKRGLVGMRARRNGGRATDDR
jgi:hypothetical protein